MKSGTPDHPKMRRLALELDVSKCTAVGILACLWSWAKDYVPAGNVGKYLDESIADAIDWRGDAGELVQALVRSGWLDEHIEHRLIIHDWPDHCEDSVHTYLAKRRKLFADGSMPRLTKFNKSERQVIENEYSEASKARACAPIATALRPIARINAQECAEARGAEMRVPIPIPIPIPEVLPQSPSLGGGEGLFPELAELEPLGPKAPKSREDSEITDWFEREFWPPYPRKLSKAEARKWCAKHAKAPIVRREIVDGLATWQAEFASRELSKIPHPATFLNSRCWEPDSRPQPRASPSVRPAEPVYDGKTPYAEYKHFERIPGEEY